MSFTIRELENLSGIRAHTIRMWEQRYRFLKPSRTATNIRTYSNEELKTLLTVALLNRHGYKISRIDNMEPEQREQVVLALPGLDADWERALNDLIGAMIDFQTPELERILDEAIAKAGLTQALELLIFPFLEKVGVLWQTSRILPIQEHLVSSVLRQKFLKAIDELPYSDSSDRVHVLFLPEREHHELGLIIVHYLLRKRGVPVLFLGANLPISDLEVLLLERKVDAVYTHLTISNFSAGLERYFTRLSKALPFNLPILISGNIEDYVVPPLRQRITHLRSFEDVQSYINRL